MKEILNIDALHEALEKVHKNVSKNNQMDRNLARRRQNAKTSILPVHVSIGEYVIVRTYAKREFKLQSKWNGPMSVKETKFNLVFVAENLLNTKQRTFLAQRISLCPIARGSPNILEQVKLQALTI